MLSGQTVRLALTILGTVLAGLILSTFVMIAVLYLGGIRSFDVLFSGFTNSAPWLLMGLTLLARAVSLLGLDFAVIRRLFPSGAMTPLQILRAYWIGNVVLTPLMPSGAGKTLVMLPSAQWLGRQVGGNSFERAVLLLIVYVSGVAAKLFMMSAMALLVTAIMNEYLETPLTWFRWLVMATVPVLGLLLLLYNLLRWRFFTPDGQPKDAQVSERLQVGDLMAEEQKTEARVEPAQIWKGAIILFTFLLAWTLEDVHHIHPMAMSFIAVVLIYLPGLGALPLGSASVMLPTQSIPGMLVTSTNRLSRPDLFRFGALFTVASLVWLLIVSLTYWRWLGEPLAW